jgi:hypothetical protein
MDEGCKFKIGENGCSACVERLPRRDGAESLAAAEPENACAERRPRLLAGVFCVMILALEIAK